MSHVLPYLSVDTTGHFSKEPFKNAMKSIYTSTLNCNGNDLAEWQSDGPINMPNFVCCGATQRMGGRVTAIHVNPTNQNEILIGASTFGIMKTIDGGVNWVAVTDDESFPVLEVKQIISDPNDDQHILAITGYSLIEGGLMHSYDGGESWATELPNLDLAAFNTGVLTFEVSDFSIEENDFYGDDSNTDFTHGVVVQEGEGAIVSVYNNKMNNLGSGAIGAGDNDDLDQEYGLRFICNKNTGNKTDMEVRVFNQI